MMIQSTVSVGANTVNDNVLAGNQYEFVSVPAMIVIGVVGSAIGFELDVLVGSQAIVTRLIPILGNRMPIANEDFIISFPAIPGDRIILRANNTTGGALVLYFVVRFNPVG